MKERKRIERSFNTLKQFRRVTIRYDKLPAHRTWASSNSELS